MSNRSKYSKFFIYAPAKNGSMKGCRLLGTNSLHVDGANNLTVNDLISFLKENNIHPSDVALPRGFITQTRLTLRVSDIVAMKAIGNPVCLAQKLDTPGVYKLRKGGISAAIVITTNGQVHYVNDDVIDSQSWSDYSQADVWMTKSPAPAKITLQ